MQLEIDLIQKIKSEMVNLKNDKEIEYKEIILTSQQDLEMEVKEKQRLESKFENLKRVYVDNLSDIQKIDNKIDELVKMRMDISNVKTYGDENYYSMDNGIMRLGYGTGSGKKFNYG